MAVNASKPTIKPGEEAAAKRSLNKKKSKGGVMQRLGSGKTGRIIKGAMMAGMLGSSATGGPATRMGESANVKGDAQKQEQVLRQQQQDSGQFYMPEEGSQPLHTVNLGGDKKSDEQQAMEKSSLPVGEQAAARRRFEQRKVQESQEQQKKSEDEQPKKSMAERAESAKNKVGSGVQTAGRAGQATGATMQATGATMQAAGKVGQVASKGAQAAGKGMEKGGQAMMRAGAGLSSTGVGAIAGVPLVIAGGATTAAGVGVDGAGKMGEVAGKGLDKGGQAVKKGGKGVRKVGKRVSEAGKKIKSGPGEKTGVVGSGIVGGISGKLRKARMAAKNIPKDPKSLAKAAIGSPLKPEKFTWQIVHSTVEGFWWDAKLISGPIAVSLFIVRVVGGYLLGKFLTMRVAGKEIQLVPKFAPGEAFYRVPVNILLGLLAIFEWTLIFGIVYFAWYIDKYLWDPMFFLQEVSKGNFWPF